MYSLSKNKKPNTQPRLSNTMGAHTKLQLEEVVHQHVRREEFEQMRKEFVTKNDINHMLMRLKN